jgi:hypothetical protein
VDRLQLIWPTTRVAGAPEGMPFRGFCWSGCSLGAAHEGVLRTAKALRRRAGDSSRSGIAGKTTTSPRFLRPRGSRGLPSRLCAS